MEKFKLLKLLMLLVISIAAISFRNEIQQNPKWEAPPAADLLVNPFSNSTVAASVGKTIFEKKCWTCHGLEGKGNGPASAKLNPKPANYTDSFVQAQTDGALWWKISTGRGAMPSFKSSITLEQRWHLVNYIRELGKGI